MSKASSIEWTHHTFNPWWGCTKVSPGCTHCYAEASAQRWGFKIWGKKAPRRFFGDKHWQAPLAWNLVAERDGQRKRVFCASMADVFEADAALDPCRARLWKLITATPWLDWLLLTKRPENVGAMSPWGASWPANVWLGTTVESAEWAAKRIPELLQHPAAIRFLSAEPLLGPIDLAPWLSEIDWVIVGGESGNAARHMQPAWARTLRDQCVEAGVAFHFKQWGTWRPTAAGLLVPSSVVVPDAVGEEQVTLVRLGKKKAGRELDGRTWDEVPSPRRPAPSGSSDQDHEPQRGLLRGADGADSSAKPQVTNARKKSQEEVSMEKTARKRRNKAKRITPGARRRQRMEFVIDKEIAGLIPSLSPEEFAQLERSLLAEGCREPLIVLLVGGKKILGDGHNRYGLCHRHGIKYELKHVELPDRDAAIRWVREHQLGRRNLTPEAQSYLRGGLYNDKKRQGARSDLTSGQAAQKSTTAQQLAAEYKVDEKTIRRDGRFAAQLDALADDVGTDIKDEVLTRGARISRADVPRLLQLDEQTRRRIVAEVRQGARASALLREARLGTDENVHEEADLAQHGVDRTRVSAEPQRARTRDANSESANINDILEQLVLVEGTLRTASPGSLSPEMIARASELLRTLDAALALHRSAAVAWQDGPRADVAGAVEAAIGIQKVLIVDKALELTGLGLQELREGEALIEPLAEMERAMVRLSRPDRRQRRGAPRRPITVPKFMKALQPILPPNSTLAQEHGDVLRALEVFDLAEKYLRKIEPAIGLAYNHHATMRANNSSSTGICNAIDRFIDHGRAFVAGQYTFLHHLEAQGVPLAIFHDAEAALVREVREGTRAAFASLGERLKYSPSPTPAAPAASSSIQWPITAALDESGFKELCEIVRDCDAAMEQGCTVLAEIYQGRPMPPGAERVWHDASDTVLRCRPLIDGTFTHADHLRAWGAHPSSQLAGRAAEVTTEANAPARPNAAVAPASGPTSSVSEKPTTKQWAEYEQLCQGYGKAMVPPEGVLAEIKQKDWPEDLKERARGRIVMGWQIATAPSPPLPRAGA